MDNKVYGMTDVIHEIKRVADAVEKTTNYRTGEVTELRGIRNALEEILRLVKKDLDAADAYRRQQNEEN